MGNTFEMPKNSVRQIIKSCLTSLVINLAMLGGCATYHPESWGYVYNIGDADQITRWGLEQTDSRRIFDCLHALLGLACSADLHESHRAMDGYVEVYKKLLAGWPGYTGQSYDVPEASISAEVRTQRLENLIRHCYRSVASAAIGQKDMSRQVELYRRIMPSPSDKERFKVWMYEKGGILQVPGY